MISDERLAETIDELEPFNNLVQVVDGGDIKEFLIELQQHRAEKHERRWRKISVEGLPEKEGDYEFSWKTENSLSADKSYIDAYSLFIDDCGVRSWVDDRDSFDDETMKQSYVHWRPQDTDLPEGE